jgi:hypothetical protein
MYTFRPAEETHVYQGKYCETNTPEEGTNLGMACTLLLLMTTMGEARIS